MQRVRGFLFPESDVDRARTFSDSGDYQSAERNAVLAFGRRFRRAVEVGAHVGLHTRFLAGAYAAVEAFEPQPLAFRCLVANVAGLGVATHAAALSNKVRSAFIPVKTGEDSGSNEIEGERQPGSDPCPTRTLDEYGWSDVDLLRIAIDRPGQILAGAIRTIERSRPMLWLAASPASDMDIALTLGRLGYRLVASLPNGVVLSTSDARGRALLASDQVITDAALGNRLLRWSPASTLRATAKSAVAVDGVVRPAETFGFQVDEGRGELLVATLGAEPPPSSEVRVLHRGTESRIDAPPVTTLDAVLAQVKVAFRRGAFELSAPPAALAYFREAVIGLVSPAGEQIVARRDLLQQDNLDAIEIRAPQRLVSAAVSDMSLRLRTPAGEERRLTLPARFDPAEFSAEMVTCYLNHGGGGNPVINAFAASMGSRLAYAEDGARDGVALVWGVLRGSKDVIDDVAARDGFFYYIDHAYFARGHLRSYRVTRNGFEAGAVRECPTDRLEALDVDVKPWRSGGRYVLVCPPTDYFMQAHNAHSWLEDTLVALRKHTDREIVVREKPQPGETVIPLAEAMAGAHALVTHSSNVAVEAVVAGTPVFVAPSSAAAPMGRTDLALIETPVRPERQAWLAHLAYSQFSFEEVKYGEAWRLLREFETRPFAREG